MPRRLLAALAAASGSGAGSEVTWRSIGTDIHALFASTARVRIPKGAVLLNLGTSWSAPNYLLNIRSAQAARGLRYVPFVHDCIPMLRPDLCAPGLPAQFVSWLAGAGLAADSMIASTAATAGQVRAALTETGIEPPPIGIVPLDAKSSILKSTGMHGLSDHPVVPDRPYILFVSTLEPRKDHALAFRAWQSLAEQYGPDVVPQLVCVGNPGWRNEAAYEVYAGDPRLAGLVTILSNLDDTAVAALYMRCLCVLYPSLLEGWGLPVTEALSFGKVPIVARTAGVTEAAGQFGEYFEPGSLAGLVAAVERVCFDAAHRRAAEARIGVQFQPRDWQAVADAFADEAVATALRPHRPAVRRIAGLGRYFAFGSNRSLRLGPDMPLGEHLRCGSGWLEPEVWGCRSRTEVAEFVLPVRADGQRTALATCLRNTEDAAVSVVMSVAGKSVSHLLLPGQTQWAGLVLKADRAFNDGVQVELRSRVSGPTDRARYGIGIVGAVVHSGVDVGNCLRRAAVRLVAVA